MAKVQNNRGEYSFWPKHQFVFNSFAKSPFLANSLLYIWHWQFDCHKWLPGVANMSSVIFIFGGQTWPSQNIKCGHSLDFSQSIYWNSFPHLFNSQLIFQIRQPWSQLWWIFSVASGGRETWVAKKYLKGKTFSWAEGEICVGARDWIKVLPGQ